MVGSATVTEAAGRSHEVVSASRSGRHAEGATQDVTLTLADTQTVVDLINISDVTVIAVSAGRGEPAQPVIDAHRALIAAAPTGRIIVVGGAGSLLTPDGTRLVDTPGLPEEYKPEALRRGHRRARRRRDLRGRLRRRPGRRGREGRPPRPALDHRERLRPRGRASPQERRARSNHVGSTEPGRSSLQTTTPARVCAGVSPILSGG